MQVLTTALLPTRRPVRQITACARISGLGLAAGLAVAAPCPAGTAATGSPPPLSDARVVFCLSADQRPRLVDAAVALELVGSGTEPERVRLPAPTGEPSQLDLPTWRRLRPADFARACGALADGTASLADTAAAGTTPEGTAAGQGAPAAGRGTESTGSWLRGIVNLLVPLLFGALLTWGTSRRQRRAELAEVLRSRIRDLAEATREWTAEPSGSGRAAVRDTRLQELRTSLDRVHATRRRRGLPPELEDLRQGRSRLITEFQGMAVLPPAEATRRQEAIDQALEKIHQTGELVAQALEHPFRPHRQLRRTR